MNSDIADRFALMADVLELLEANRFKVLAFERGARVLRDLVRDVGEIAEDLNALTALEGIGKGLAEKIREFARTGTVAEIDATVSEIPPGVLELLQVPGLGPKTAALLWKKGQVTSLSVLRTKLASGELTQLPRLGEKALEKIKKSLAFMEQSADRHRLGDLLPLAEHWVNELRRHPAVQQADYAGSLRRGCETAADIDLIVCTIDPKRDAGTLSSLLTSHESVGEVLASGSKKTSVRLKDGIQIDLRIVEPIQYGAALQYFTGSKEHNVQLRERALQRRLRLNEYGLWTTGADGSAENFLCGENEEEIYRHLDLALIPPELREARGEIEAVERQALPQLLTLADIRCELHAHTTASDGHWSILELAQAAKARGFHTVAVTDHSQSSAIAGGLKPEELEKHIRNIRKANDSKPGIRILAGSEVDILADGALDYPDSLLAELDLVVASPHAALSQDPEKCTARLLRAIENPFVHLIGHPTGRLIGRREGLKPDMSRLIRAAAETGTALEINSSHYRLDLCDIHAKAAIEAGVLLAINTDAHGPGDLDELRYGILTARRAWARPEHVVNCLPAGKLSKWLQAKRKKYGR